MNDAELPETEHTGLQPIDRKLLETLICPVTHGVLSYDSKAQELISKGANLAFPIRNGIPVMLVDEARQLS